MSGAAKSGGKYYHPTSKQTVFFVVDKGEACGEVNGTRLLALSLSLPGLTVQLSLRASPPLVHLLITQIN